MAHFKLYKTAKIYDAKGDVSQRWFAYFYTYDSKLNKLVRKREYVPNSLNAEERYAALAVLVKSINKLLKEGKIINQAPKQKAKKEIVTESLELALEHKKNYCTHRSYLSFRNALQHLKRWLKRNAFDKIYTTQFTKSHAIQYLRETHQKRGWSAKTYNLQLGFIKTLFEDAIERDVIKDNPFARLKSLPMQQSEIILWNDYQKRTLADWVKENDPQLFIVVLLVYHCFIRPQEIVRLTIGDFDLGSGIIYIKGSQAKNRKSKSVTLSTQLIEMLTPILRAFPKDYLLISRDLKPGKKQIAITRINTRFNKAKAACELPDRLKLYSLKHTGNSELLAKGVSLELLKEQNRHHSVSQTEIYAKRIQNIAIEQFMDAPSVSSPEIRTV